MALKYIDDYGFWTATPGTFQATSNSSISSGKLLTTWTGGWNRIANYLTAQSTYIFNVRMNISATPGLGGRGGMFALQDTPGGGIQAGLYLYNNGKMQFLRGGINVASPIGDVSTIAILVDAGVTYYDYELKIVIGNSGSIELRVNGGVQIGPTTVDTQQTANSTADAAYIVEPQNNVIGSRVEHAILMDGSGGVADDFIGPVDVQLLPPTGDGFYTAWNFTGAASRWEAVQSPPDGDTSYVYAASPGDQITFTHGSLPAGYTDVKMAAVWTYARRDDGTTRAFKTLLRNATPTDDLGSNEHFVGDDYIWFFQPYELNPFTSAAWSISEINAVEYGAEVTV